MLTAFTKEFEFAMDVRKGRAAQCKSNSDCDPLVITEPCCANVGIRDTKAGVTETFERCMAQETVKYGYGVTIDSKFKVKFDCMSLAQFMGLGVIASGISFIAMAIV